MIAPPAADVPPPTDPTPPVPPPPPVEKVLAWPAWVKSIDAAMLVLVLVAAFLAASNVARNSDQWLYYAGGRALLNGQYSLGTDPFSYATAGRTWVNHAWLSSVAAYLLFKAEPAGFMIVAVKAGLVAAAFGIVLLVRRPGRSLWPWVLVAAVAVVAAAPHTGLRPLVASAFFLAVTLYVLLGRDWTTGGRTNTIALGVLFWLWASSDAWFFLGPLAVGLTLLGEWLECRLTKRADDGKLRRLAQTLAVGVVAASLTPHHVRVWQLPVELGFHLPDNYKSDRELRGLTLSPTDSKSYIEEPTRGNNQNGLAFAVLLIGGGVALAAAGGFGRLRVTPILLWVLFAGLALAQYRLILFFSVAAVPLVGLALNDLLDRVRLDPAAGTRTKLLLLLSGLGRILGFPAALLFVAVAYPGKLQPPPIHPGLSTRAAWRVEAEPGLQRTAELLNEWRTSGKLPADYRGLIVTFDLANYVAWFAPQEKVFLNGRYAFHGPEVADVIAARRLFRRPQDRDDRVEAVEIANFHESGRQHGWTYVVNTGGEAGLSAVNTWQLFQLTAPQGGYALWHADGRAVVLGDLTAAAYRPDAFAALALDPVRLAFGPGAAEVKSPPDGTRKVATEPSFLDAFFLDPPKPPGLDLQDAVIWLGLGNQLAAREQYAAVGDIVQVSDDAFQVTGWPAVAAAVGNPLVAREARMRAYHVSDAVIGYKMLAYRAGWRALAANPNDPDVYLLLAEVAKAGPYELPGIAPDVRRQLLVSGLRQYLDRIPPPEASTPTAAQQAFLAAMQLQEQYQQFAPEAASDVLALARKFRVRYEGALDPKVVEAENKKLDALAKNLQQAWVGQNDQFQRASRSADAAARVGEAANRRLFVTAAKAFADAYDAEQLGADPLGLALTAVDVDILLGRLDEADFFLAKAEERIAEAKAKGGVPPQPAQKALQLRTQLWRLRGDFAKLGEQMEQSIPRELLELTADERATVQHVAASPSPQAFDAYLISPPALVAAVGTTELAGQLSRQPAVAKWITATQFFNQRAVLALFEGRIANAKDRLEQAVRPLGVELPAYHPQRQAAERYLKMIHDAAK